MSPSPAARACRAKRAACRSLPATARRKRRSRATPERADRSVQPLAPETGTDEQKHDIRLAGAKFGARRRAQRGAMPRMEVIQIHSVVDDMQFVRRNAKPALDLPAHHRRVADHCRKAGCANMRRSAAQTYRWYGLSAMPSVSGRRGASDLQPFGVHAVARAIDVAAGDPLVRLDQVEAAGLPGARGRRARTTRRARCCRGKTGPLRRLAARPSHRRGARSASVPRRRAPAPAACAR